MRGGLILLTLMYILLNIIFIRFIEHVQEATVLALMFPAVVMDFVIGLVVVFGLLRDLRDDI